jgi:hypothetical protein
MKYSFSESFKTTELISLPSFNNLPQYVSTRPMTINAYVHHLDHRRVLVNLYTYYELPEPFPVWSYLYVKNQ